MAHKLSIVELIKRSAVLEKRLRVRVLDVTANAKHLPSSHVERTFFSRAETVYQCICAAG